MTAPPGLEFWGLTSFAPSHQAWRAGNFRRRISRNRRDALVHGSSIFDFDKGLTDFVSAMIIRGEASQRSRRSCFGIPCVVTPELSRTPL